jgi:hypothetical protein
MAFAEHKSRRSPEHKREDNKELFMSRIVTVVLVACVAAPLAAQAQGKQPMSDSDYCAALSERYVRYVGRSEAGPDSPVRPDVNGGVALAQCKEGNFATAIPILERKLTNAKVELPPRSPGFDYLRPR